MIFSIAVIPASAANETSGNDTTVIVSGDSVPAEDEFAGVVDSANGIYEDLQEGEFESAINGVIALIEDLADSIHNLIGNVMSVIGKNCALCGELHNAASDNYEALV